MDEGVLEFVAKLTDDATEQAKQVRKVMDGLGGPVDAIEATVRMETEGVAAVVGDVDAAGAKAEASAEASGKDAGSGFVEAFKASFAGNVLAEAVTGAAEAAGAAFGQVWDQAVGAELSTDILTAQLGATAEQSEMYGQVAGQLYAGAYGDSLEEVNTAVGAVVSSVDGMSEANASTLEGATRDVLNYAAAFDTDVARAAQVAGQLVRTGLASDFDEAMAMMTASSQQVPAAIREDLLDAADEYGPFFAQLGMSGEDAFAALVTGADQGMYGLDKTGDALKELTIRATDMSATSVAAYEAAGLNAEDMAARFLAGGDTAAGAMSDLVAGLQGIEDPAEQANAAIALFGTPLEDLGTGQIPEFLGGLSNMGGGLGDLDGTMTDLNDTLAGNTATSFEAARRQFLDIGADVLSRVLPPLTAFLTWATETPGAVQAMGAIVAGAFVLVGASAVMSGINATMSLGKIVGGWIKAGGAAVAGAAKQVAAWVLAGATATVQAARMAAAWVVGVVAPAARATAAMVVQVARQVAAWVVLGAQSLAQAARVALAWLIAMGPIAIVIALVIGLVALIIANWDKIVAWTKKTWQAVTSWTSQKWRQLVKTVTNLVRNLATSITSRFNAIKSGIVRIITGAVSWLVGKFKAAKSTVTGTISNLRTSLLDTFTRIRTGITDKISAALTTVREFPGKAVAAVGSLGSRLLSAGGDFIQGFINGVKNKATSLISAAKDVVSDAVGAVTSFLGISSPSKLARKLGQFFGQGLGLGAADEARYVGREAENLASAMVDPLDRAASMTATLGGPGGASLAVSGSPSVNESVTIRHEVRLTGEGAERLDEESIARMIAGNARAAATMEKAVRAASNRRQSRLVAAPA